MSAFSTVAATVVACTSMPFVQGNVVLHGKLSVASKVQAEAQFIGLERDLLAEAAAREEATAVSQRRLRGAKSNGRALWGMSKTYSQVKEATKAAHSLFNFSKVVQAAEEQGAQLDVEGFVARVATVLVEHFGKETAESLGQELESYLDSDDEEGSGRRLATAEEQNKMGVLEGAGAKLLKRQLPLTTFILFWSYKFLSTKRGRNLLWSAPEALRHFFRTISCFGLGSASAFGGDLSALASDGQYEERDCAELIRIN